LRVLGVEAAGQGIRKPGSKEARKQRKQAQEQAAGNCFEHTHASILAAPRQQATAWSTSTPQGQTARDGARAAFENMAEKT
jgi:hypothetical protein